jgi:hypothetical protein
MGKGPRKVGSLLARLQMVCTRIFMALTCGFATLGFLRTEPRKADGHLPTVLRTPPPEDS